MTSLSWYLGLGENLKKVCFMRRYKRKHFTLTERSKSYVYVG